MGWAAIPAAPESRETRAIPVIVLTGHDFKAYLSSPRRRRRRRLVPSMKPCFPEQLAREVGACLTAGGIEP